MSRKGSPWENGHRESFFSHLKQEAGDLNRFDTDRELIEEFYRIIYYYNQQRDGTIRYVPKDSLKEDFLVG